MAWSSSGRTGSSTWRWLEVVAGNLDAAVELTDDALEAALDAGNAQAAAWLELPRRAGPCPPRRVTTSPGEAATQLRVGPRSTTSRRDC